MRPGIDDKIASLKVPPHSIDSEQAVLAALMLDSTQWEGIDTLLRPVDFYRKEHRLIFEAMKSQQDQGKPIDVITISEALRQTGKLGEAGGIDYLSELMHSNQSAANIMAYAGIVHERSMLRHLIGVGHGIADSGYNAEGRPADELIELAENAVFGVADLSKTGAIRDPHPIYNNLKDRVEALEQRHENKGKMFGLATGFRDLDDLLLGMVDGDMIVLAGRSSMGKTSAAMNIAEHIAIKEGKLAIIFSLEMPEWKLTDRIICSIGRIDNTRYRRGDVHNEDWDKLSTAMAKLRQAPIYIDDDSTLTSTQLVRRARRIASKHGTAPAIIVIDYMQLLKDESKRGDSSGEQKTSAISMNIKNLAREMKCPVVALSQLNRNLEQRPNKRPIMSDLRSSGSIEQDADAIVFVYRDEVYNANSIDKGIAEFIVAKSRDGKTGMVKVSTLLQHYRFENLVQPYRQAEYAPQQKQNSWLPDD